MFDALHYLEIGELSRLLAARKVSPVELTEEMLRRIERVDPSLKSYALATPELALAQARAAEQMIGRRQILSQLHGVPVAVKDLCWTEGIATAAGMPLHRDFVPTVDATAVRKLREAGAVLLGKLQLTEGAFADHHPDVAAPVNPWHRDHWSGASSSGSGVATAAGLCFGSLGSDTGGSIRFPSAANGVTGLKPTWGRVSRFGCFELAASLDHIGPMCRSAADAAIVLQAIAGSDPRRPDRAACRRCPTTSPATTARCAACGSASTSTTRSTTSRPTSAARSRRRSRPCARSAPRSSRCAFPTSPR